MVSYLNSAPGCCALRQSLIENDGVTTHMNVDFVKIQIIVLRKTNEGSICSFLGYLEKSLLP
jgi:hypothetical protein